MSNLYTTTTRRRNGRWVVITKRPGMWTVAQGFQGVMVATHVRSVKSKSHALVVARSWLDDK